MRLTCFSIVLALTVGFLADRTLAQLPERVTFQPGSFAHGYRPGTPQPVTVVVETEAAQVVDVENDETPQTEWEAAFGENSKIVVYDLAPGHASTAAPSAKPPYLAWHRSPITGRIHLIPYQPGYAETPEQFPTHQSHLNLWLSSLPCREQNRPQQKYLSYYDPMPEVLTDKPSRCQLILGYDDPNWTASCCNSPGRARTAHCPGVDPICPGGPSAEARIADQPISHGPINGRGIFAGPAPYVGYHLYGNPRRSVGAFNGLGSFNGPGAFNNGFCSCPQCQQQRREQCPACPPQPCPSCPKPQPSCADESSSCSDSAPCNDCINKRPCTHRKSLQTLQKNAPKKVEK